MLMLRFSLCLEQLRLCHLCFREQTWLVHELKRVFHICKPAGRLFNRALSPPLTCEFEISFAVCVLSLKRDVAGFTISTVTRRLVEAV